MQNGLLVKYFNSRNITIGDIEVNKNYMNSFMPKRNYYYLKRAFTNMRINRRSNSCTNYIISSSISLDEI